MSLPPETVSFTEDEAVAVSESIPEQIASARAAVAKHHARLVDQLDSDGRGPAPFESGSG
ncbi:hypothetical protein [Brevundimonas sp. Root1279]|uniref:hypothetical protein n=1 Tax=Brevundimonas sp. Root1279 TaxID=1736443 RepID=UPI0012E3532C|nr:hypothetical protein [Brevundimonas sp. Root1279]